MPFPKMTHKRHPGPKIRMGLMAVAVAGLLSGGVWFGAPADAAAISPTTATPVTAVKAGPAYQRSAGLMAVQLQAPALATAAASVHTTTAAAARPGATPGARYGLLAILLAAFAGMATLTTNLWREAGRSYDQPQPRRKSRRR